jgi:hypothetical protein
MTNTILSTLIGLATLVVAYHGLTKESREELNSLLIRYCKWLEKDRCFLDLNGRVQVLAYTSIVSVAELLAVFLMLAGGIVTLYLCFDVLSLAKAQNYPLLDLPLLSLSSCSVGGFLLCCWAVVLYNQE